MTDDQAAELPHNVEAEQQVLGAILNDNLLLDRVDDLLSPDDFYEPLHGRIYRAARDRIQAGSVVSPVTLKPVFENDDSIRELGGIGYLAVVAGAAVAEFAVRDYAQIVVEAKAKRDLLAGGERMRTAIHKGAASAAEIAMALEADASRVTERASVRPLIHSHLAGLTKALTRMTDVMNGAEAGLGTGIAGLDERIGGFRPGQMIVVAGRPAMGKTTVVQNMAAAAIETGHGVFFASLEMTQADIATRFLSRGLARRGHRIPYANLVSGRVSEDQMREVVIEAKAQESWPMVVAERDVRDTGRLRSAVRRAANRMADTPCPLGLVVIDYVQLIQAEGARSIYERASLASDTAKSIAMDLGLPVVVASQLSREVERRDPCIPMLADLRETGKLEEDADVVMFCYRHAYYLQKQLDSDDGQDLEHTADLTAMLERCRNDLTLFIAKQRSGAETKVNAQVDLATCLVTDAGVPWNREALL